MFGSNKLLCTQCGNVGTPRIHTPGSIILEILCWLIFCFPGILYTFWRLSARRNVCAHCGSPSVIPVNSPNAQMILQYRSSGAVPLPPPGSQPGQ